MKKNIVSFIETIPGWLSIAEGAFLEKAVKDTKAINGEIVEIGSFCGKSTIWLAQAAKKVHAVDPHKGYVEETMHFKPTYKTFFANLKKTHVSHKVVPIVATSQDAIKKWKQKIRVLFIDGLHDEKNALLDLKSWTPFVVEGGIVAIHDSFKNWCGSEKVAVNYLVFSSEYYKIGHIDSIIYGVKGKGNWIDKLLKVWQQIFILTSIELNHVLIVCKMLLNFFNKSFKITSLKTN